MDMDLDIYIVFDFYENLLAFLFGKEHPAVAQEVCP